MLILGMCRYKIFRRYRGFYTDTDTTGELTVNWIILCKQHIYQCMNYETANGPAHNNLLPRVHTTDSLQYTSHSTLMCHYYFWMNNSNSSQNKQIVYNLYEYGIYSIYTVKNVDVS